MLLALESVVLFRSGVIWLSGRVVLSVPRCFAGDVRSLSQVARPLSVVCLALSLGLLSPSPSLPFLSEALPSLFAVLVEALVVQGCGW